MEILHGFVFKLVTISSVPEGNSLRKDIKLAVDSELDFTNVKEYCVCSTWVPIVKC